MPLCNRLNILVLGRQPYTQFPGPAAAATVPPLLNAQPTAAITTGLPWSPVLVGRPGAALTTGDRAKAIRKPFYAAFGPSVATAVILTYTMTASGTAPYSTCGGSANGLTGPVSYKEAEGTLVAYPRADPSKAAALTGTPSGMLTFVFRWCAPFTSACTGLPILGTPAFEIVANTATSVRFLQLSEPVAVPMGSDPDSVDPRCMETCVLMLVEQACPPVPACLPGCYGPPARLSTVVDSSSFSTTPDGVRVVTVLYSSYSGVANLRVNPVNPAPQFTSVVVQPVPGTSHTVAITFMFSGDIVSVIQFTITGDILSPPCVHDTFATSLTSGLITVVAPLPPA
jgi:hypothetical protein